MISIEVSWVVAGHSRGCREEDQGLGVGEPNASHFSGGRLIIHIVDFDTTQVDRIWVGEIIDQDDGELPAPEIPVTGCGEAKAF